MEWWMWACLVGLPLAGWFIYLEKKVDRWTTRILKVQGGARFEAHGWTVEIQRVARQVLINAVQAELTIRQGDEAPQVTNGPVRVTLDAAALRVEVAPEVQQVAGELEPKPTGLWSVRFIAKPWEPPADLPPIVQPEMPQMPEQAVATVPAAQPMDSIFQPLEPLVQEPVQEVAETEPVAVEPVRTTEVVIGGLPSIVVRGFQPFGTQLGLWVERIERILTTEEAKRRKAESERLAAMAEAAAKAAQKASLSQIKDPLTRQMEQIAGWRQKAGFEGTTSAHGANRMGFVDWFVDLDPTGRITLVNGDNVIHTNLRGATVSSLTGELEVSVFPENASAQSDPRKFRILKGESGETRRAWKDRLLMLRDELNRTDPTYMR